MTPTNADLTHQNIVLYCSYMFRLHLHYLQGAQHQYLKLTIHHKSNSCYVATFLQLMSTSVIKMIQTSFKVVTHYNDTTVILTDLLNPTGHMMHQQFNIQQLYFLPTLYLCVLCLSENKQRLMPLTA